MAKDPRKPIVSGPMGMALAVGLEFALALAIGFLGGQWLDTKLGTEPWLMMFGLIVGIGAGIKLLLERTQEPKKPNPPNTP